MSLLFPTGNFKGRLEALGLPEIMEYLRIARRTGLLVLKQGDFEKAKAAFIARQPMGRLAQADEIAGLVVYLASDEAAFITGQTFTIDGGMSV